MIDVMTLLFYVSLGGNGLLAVLLIISWIPRLIYHMSKKGARWVRFIYFGPNGQPESKIIDIGIEDLQCPKVIEHDKKAFVFDKSCLWKFPSNLPFLGGEHAIIYNYDSLYPISPYKNNSKQMPGTLYEILHEKIVGDLGKPAFPLSGKTAMTIGVIAVVCLTLYLIVTQVINK